MNQDGLEYASPQTRNADKRSGAQWAILLTTWAVGLVIWAAYIAAIGLLMLRLL